MPRRSALANVSVVALQSELQRRTKRLSALLKLRDDVDRQITELRTLAGRFGTVVKRGRKAKVTAKPVPKRRRKRGTFKQTAEQLVLSLLQGGKTLTTAELTAAWKQAGRGGKVDNALTKLVKLKQVKRRKVQAGQGSRYVLA